MYLGIADLDLYVTVEDGFIYEMYIFIKYSYIVDFKCI